MDQALFSKITLKYLKENYPDFVGNIDFKKDQSFDCFIKSIQGNRFLWVATYDLEITIGFENHNKECDWHFHIGASGGNSLNEELELLTKELNKILNNEQVFILEDGKYIPLDKNDEIDVKEDEKLYVWDEI
ncbi:hypothetical protein [Flavobacterium sp. F52]|uniref:hypothetical protein n=1 Tax=Flavobacterium sp. F52 TaxID=1202532 RepID=UPI000272F31C|nr:hypothetical protein [Flavobacterium sp. F52]EJG01194.1 hypothetical protein FF52_13066 [Flavobacterium sp. F52]